MDEPAQISATKNITNEPSRTGWICFENTLTSKPMSRKPTTFTNCTRCSYSANTISLKCSSTGNFSDTKPTANMPIQNKVLKDIQDALKTQKVPNGTEIIHFSTCQQEPNVPNKRVRYILHKKCPKCPGLFTYNSKIMENVGNVSFAPEASKLQVINLSGPCASTLRTMNDLSDIPTTSTSNSDGVQSDYRTYFEHEIFIPGILNKGDWWLKGDKLIRNDCDRWKNIAQPFTTNHLQKLPSDISQVVPESLLKPDYAEYLNLHQNNPLVQCDDQFIQDLLMYTNDKTFGGKFKKNINNQKNKHKCDTTLSQAIPRKVYYNNDTLTKIPVDISQVVPDNLLKADYAEYLDLNEMQPLIQCDDQFIQDLLIYPNNKRRGKFGKNDTYQTLNRKMSNKGPRCKVIQLKK